MLENIFSFFRSSENRIYCSLVVFAIFLIAQNSMLYLLHDDWGLSVLHYVIEQGGFQGQDFSFSQSINFLWDLYNRWSGRVVSISFLIYLSKAGIWYIRIWQVIAIFSIVFLAYKITTKALDVDKKSSFLLLSMALYMVLPDRALITGVYWFSASSCYLWGIPFFLFGVYLTMLTDKVSFFPYVLMMISATFHELMGVAVIAYLFMSAFFYIGEISFKRVAYYLLPTLAAAVTILSPGNFARKKVSNYGDSSIFEHVISNFNTLVDRLFSPEQLGVHNVFFVLLGLSFLSMFWKLVLQRFSLSQRLLILLTTILFFSLSTVLSGIVFILIYSALLYYSCRTLDAKKIILPIYASSIAALIPLLLAPGLPWRSELIFMVLTFVPILYSIGQLNRKNEVFFRNFFIFSVMLFATFNSYKIFDGYRKNSAAHQANDYILRSVSTMIARKDDVGDTVMLFKLPEPYYAETMPYDRPLIERWMKKYYSLPDNIVFSWR